MKKYIFFSQIKVQLIRNKIECVAYRFDTGVTFTSEKKMAAHIGSRMF